MINGIVKNINGVVYLGVILLILEKKTKHLNLKKRPLN